jgi:archaellum biogenesis ATPase FlaH
MILNLFSLQRAHLTNVSKKVMVVHLAKNVMSSMEPKVSYRVDSHT